MRAHGEIVETVAVEIPDREHRSEIAPGFPPAHDRALGPQFVECRGQRLAAPVDDVHDTLTAVLTGSRDRQICVAVGVEIGAKGRAGSDESKGKDD